MFLRSFCAVLLVGLMTGCGEIVRPEADGFASHQHGKIYYKIYGSGKPIIVLHGGPEMNQEYLKPHLLELAKDYKLIFIDQRGGGRSNLDTIDESTVSMSHFVKDIEQIRQHLKLDKVTLMGHSWGGFVAMNYAVNYQDNLDSLILIAPAPADFKHQKEFIDVLLEKLSGMRETINEMNNNVANMAPNEITNIYKKINRLAYFYDLDKAEELNIGINFNSFADSLLVKDIIVKNHFLKPDTTLPKKLKSLKVPTLIVHGSNDSVPLSASSLISTTIKDGGGQAQLLELPKCGHYPFVEQKDAFFQSVRGFLNK